MSIKNRIQKLETKNISGDTEIVVAWEKGGELYTSSNYDELIPREKIKALESSEKNVLIKILYRDEVKNEREKQTD